MLLPRCLPQMLKSAFLKKIPIEQLQRGLRSEEKISKNDDFIFAFEVIMQLLARRHIIYWTIFQYLAQHWAK